MRIRTSLSFRLQAVALAGAIATVCLPMPAGAQTAGSSDPRARRLAVSGARGVGVAVGTHVAAIVGSAWNSDNSPIPSARLRLRNVETGRIEATTVADESGQFTFEEREPGSYIVELVSDNGKILTVGHPFTLGPGETVATFVRLGTKAPWFNGFFGNAALAVATAAAATGLTALAPEEMQPVSGRQ